MFDYLSKVSDQVLEFFSGLSPIKKLAAAATGVLVVGFIVGVFFWAGSETYRPLMTNLTPEDSAKIIRVLRDKNIPFHIDSGGKQIDLPPERLHDFRLELATMGLPENSVVGYEVFDKQSLGTTSFVQEINRVRAKEGELMRTISAIRGIVKARVHLALPKKSAFIEDQQEPTASVVIDLRPGVRLKEKQIYGIQKLVSSAVEGLDEERVAIVDTAGKMLSKNQRDPLVVLSATQMDYQRNIEKDLETRVEQILSKVVGDGGVIARVSADLDFSEVNETSRTYDADGAAAISTQNDIQTMGSKRPGPRGIAGAQSNLPDGEVAVEDNTSTTDTKKEKVISNYRVPETVRRTRLPSGTVKKLSVAVVIDGKSGTEKAEDGTEKEVVTAWSDQEIENFKIIVSSSLGVNAKRGDTIEIKNMDFKKEDLGKLQQDIETARWRKDLTKLALYAIITVIILAFFAFVVRPFIKWVTENTIDSIDSFLPQTLEELEKLQKTANIEALEEAIPIMPDRVDPEKVEGEMMKEKIISMVDSNPQKAALVLHEWVRGKKESQNQNAENA